MYQAVFLLALGSVFSDAAMLPWPKVFLNGSDTGYFLDISIGRNNLFSRDFFLSSNSQGDMRLAGGYGDLIRETEITNKSQTTVHIVNYEVNESDRLIHFLCHTNIVKQQQQQSNEHRQSSLSSPFSSSSSSSSSSASSSSKSITDQCCTVRISSQSDSESTSIISPQYLSCSVKSIQGANTCHLVAKVSDHLWKLSSPIVSVSYAIYNAKVDKTLPSSSSSSAASASAAAAAASASESGISPDDNNNNFNNNNNKEQEQETIVKCSMETSNDATNLFQPLGEVKVKQNPPNEMKDIGGAVIIQFPKSQLRVGEKFQIPVRLNPSYAIEQFTLRLTLPKKTYMKVTSITAFEKNSWEIMQQSFNSLDHNVTDILARMTRGSVQMQNLKPIFAIDLEVLQPPNGRDRVGPRIIWNLLETKWKHSEEKKYSSSVVTRFDVESSLYQHLVAVMKRTELLYTSHVTGISVPVPVWIYAVTHDNTLEDVSHLATCHSEHQSVLQFTSYECDKLIMHDMINMGPNSNNAAAGGGGGVGGGGAADATGSNGGTSGSGGGGGSASSSVGNNPSYSLPGTVTLIAKYRGKHVQWKVNMWYPDVNNYRLESSNKVLHPILGWTVPIQESFNKIEGTPGNQCRSKYQSTSLHVYTRFHRGNEATTTTSTSSSSSSPSSSVYLGGNSPLWVDLSHMVQLQINDQVPNNGGGGGGTSSSLFVYPLGALRTSFSSALSDSIIPLPGQSAYTLHAFTPGIIHIQPKFHRMDLLRSGTGTTTTTATMKWNITVSAQPLTIKEMRTQWISDIMTHVEPIQSSEATLQRFIMSLRATPGGNFIYSIKQILLIYWILSDGSTVSLTDLDANEIRIHIENHRPDLISITNQWFNDKQQNYVYPLVQVHTVPLDTEEGYFLTVSVSAVGPCSLPLESIDRSRKIFMTIQGRKPDSSWSNVAVTDSSSIPETTYKQDKMQTTFKNRKKNSSEINWTTSAIPSMPSNGLSSSISGLFLDTPERLLLLQAGNAQRKDALLNNGGGGGGSGIGGGAAAGGMADKSSSNGLHGDQSFPMRNGPPTEQRVNNNPLMIAAPPQQMLNNNNNNNNGGGDFDKKSKFLWRLDGWELGMYILLGFLALAACIFAVNCGLMAAKYRLWPSGVSRPTSSVSQYEMVKGRKRKTVSSSSGGGGSGNGGGIGGGGGGGGSESPPGGSDSLRSKSNSASKSSRTNSLAKKDPNWVWISRDNLHPQSSRVLIPPNNSSSTPSQTTVRSGDHASLDVDSSIWKPQVNVNSTGGGGVGGCVGGGGGGGASPRVPHNRVYQGEECSIRIIQNPLIQRSTVAPAHHQQQQQAPPQSAPTPSQPPALPPKRRPVHSMRPQSHYYARSPISSDSLLLQQQQQQQQSSMPFTPSAAAAAHYRGEDQIVVIGSSSRGTSHSLGRPSRLALPPPPPPQPLPPPQSHFLQQQQHHHHQHHHQQPSTTTAAPSSSSQMTMHDEEPPQPPRRTTSKYPSYQVSAAESSFRRRPSPPPWSEAITASHWEYATPQLIGMLPEDFLVKYFSSLKESMA